VTGPRLLLARGLVVDAEDRLLLCRLDLPALFTELLREGAPAVPLALGL
jgi:hypothetical protein